MFFKSPAAQKVYVVWNVVSFYVIILLIFIYCYGRILAVIRRQARVMAAHGNHGSNTAQDQSNKIQTSVIKTMILVSGLYAVTWAPVYTYTLLYSLHFGVALDRSALSAALFIGYLYICVNPFIYAVKFDPVKRVLLDLIPRKKHTQAPDSIDLHNLNT